MAGLPQSRDPPEPTTRRAASAVHPWLIGSQQFRSHDSPHSGKLSRGRCVGQPNHEITMSSPSGYWLIVLDGLH